MLVINKGWARCHRARVYIVGGDVGGVGGLIGYPSPPLDGCPKWAVRCANCGLLVGVACAAQAELAARMLPTLAGAVPMETELCQRLADGGRGLLTE